MRLKSKVAIITGGAYGIGKICSLAFASEGAKVVVCYHIHKPDEVIKEIESKGGEALAVQCDVPKEKDTQRMAQRAIERFDRIDILVNNAAFLSGIRFKPFDQTPIEEWDKLMDVNLRGMFLCCKAVIPQMQKQGKGKIINISSGVVYIGLPGFVHYVVSKGGVITLTRVIAREFGPSGIYANCITAGLINTKASQGLIPGSFDQLVKECVEKQSVKRLLQPEDLVGPLIFLASEESDAVCGQTINCDGGITYL